MRIFGFIATVMLGIMGAGIVAQVIQGMDLANMVGLEMSSAELAMWTLMPIGILVTIFVASVYNLISRRKDRDE